MWSVCTWGTGYYFYDINSYGTIHRQKTKEN